MKIKYETKIGKDKIVIESTEDNSAIVCLEDILDGLAYLYGAGLISDDTEKVLDKLENFLD